MKKIQPKDIWLLVAQVLLLSLIMLSPALISYISSGNSRLVVESMWIAFYWLAPAMGVYLVNFYLFVPLLWVRHRFWLFGVANVLLLIISNLHLINNDINTLPDYFRAGYSLFLIRQHISKHFLIFGKLVKINQLNFLYLLLHLIFHLLLII